MVNFPRKTWLVIGILLLAVVAAAALFYNQIVLKKPLFFTPPSPEKPADTQADTQPGLTAAQKLLTDYPQFIKKAFIQQQIEGTLKAVSENSWTLEEKGKTLTLANQGTNQVRFTKLPKIATGSSTKTVSPTEIKPEEVKIGDLLSISQMIDWQTGKITITGITVLPPR